MELEFKEVKLIYSSEKKKHRTLKTYFHTFV